MNWIIMKNNLMLDGQKEKWISLLISLNCTGQLCSVIEFNCDLFASTVCDWSFISLMRPHRTHSEALTSWGIWWWYPYIRCHLKCLNFTPIFVRNSDLKTTSLHYVHSVQKLITSHCAEIYKMVNEHLTPEGCLTLPAH